MEATSIRQLEEISRASFFNGCNQVEQRHFEKKQLFQESDGNVVMIPGISVASYFNPVADFSEFEAIEFEAFFASRITYLKQLENLGENWTSGKSFAPSLETLDIGKKLLLLLRNVYSTPEKFFPQLPNLTMGPIPVGGLAFEVESQPQTKLYINIYNNGQIEMEIDNNGFFSDIEVDKESLFSKVVETLSHNAEGRYYSRWRNLI